ncbi:hypothetical protein, partial [Amycolatopsis sp. H20-H5]|uniref:hypothetical protein n=1 Tax=Amycolatopsis sp. H20-H5 TaxID=3046309 RepID=UPI002DB9FDB7
FQDHRHNVMLVARSRSRADAGTCVLVSVRNAAGGDEPEVLAVPLSWLDSQDVANGQLRVGKAGDGLSVFVVPSLIRVEHVDEPVLRRSLTRSANTTTRDALRRALGQDGGH